IRMRGHGGQGGPGADGQPGPGRAAYAAQLANTAQSDQHRGLELSPLHVRIEIGAARHEHCCRAMIAHELHRVSDGDGCQVRELRQPHHEPKGLSAMFSAGGPNAGSTALGSGDLNNGSLSGPTRAAFPCRPSSRAFSTLSGEMGVSSMRTPTASYTALVTAGITGSSGPCPASLAPNGPSGSSVSTRMVWISGVSSVVGLLYSRREGILCTPLRKTCSSMRTSPSPMYTEPSTCPSTRSGLRERPMSWAIQISVGFTSPVSASPSTSTTHAEYE